MERDCRRWMSHRHRHSRTLLVRVAVLVLARERMAPKTVRRVLGVEGAGVRLWSFAVSRRQVIELLVEITEIVASVT